MRKPTTGPGWSPWRPFPDPQRRSYLCAPFGWGVYDLRLRSTRQPIYCGKGDSVALRMVSLLPGEAGGHGTRNNRALRAFVHDHLSDLEYRTVACATRDDALNLERTLKREKSYHFPT